MKRWSTARASGWRDFKPALARASSRGLFEVCVEVGLKLSICGVAIAVLLGACAGTSSAPSIPLDHSFQVSGFGMGDGSKVGVLAKAIPGDTGMVRICGAWQMQSSSPVAGRVAENFLFAAKLYLAGDEVMKRLSFFTEIPPGEPWFGKPAKCRDTKTPWLTGFGTATLQAVYPRSAFSR